MTSENAQENFPVLFVIKQQLGIMSWQIPLSTENETFYGTVSRTLCPVQNYRKVNEIAANQEILVDITTASQHDVNVTINLEMQNILLQENSSLDVIASPSEPKYFSVQFPPDAESLKLIVTSPDIICAIVSIQDPWCPVFDLDTNVQLVGAYQTMTKLAAFVVEKSAFPYGFFVVLVVKSTDEQCALSRMSILDRRKHFTLAVQPTITEREYLTATFGTIAMFLACYLFALLVTIGYCIKNCIVGDSGLSIHLENESQSPLLPSTSRTSTYGSLPDGRVEDQSILSGNSVTQRHNSTIECGESDSSSLDESDMDLLPDAELEKDVFRTKTFLYVSDLSRKRCKTLSRKSKMYLWSLLTVGIFYALPVIQLVLTYEKVSHSTGNQDLCYYNFLCSFPSGKFSDFNHVYSNIGYILLGFLFLALVWRRDLMHKKQIEMHDIYEKDYGIPRHFGLFYSMGLALMAEGLFSACYHMCPNYSNFQFDTSFMYIIAGLCMLKVYETRHPDINASAYATWMAFAFIIGVTVLGVLLMNTILRIAFSVIHVMACLALSVNVYYMGRWRLNLGIFKRIYLVVKNDLMSPTHCLRPMYKDRMILLVVANAVNCSLSLYGVLKKPQDFASFLLTIFMVNLMLYVSFYIIMKIRHGEKILPLPMLYITLSIATWSSSLYFFMQKSKNWEVTPAQSREYNKPCLIWNFYDDHDIWHFLSAASMFLSFMILLTLDDDLIHTPRQRIPVF